MLFMSTMHLHADHELSIATQLLSPLLSAVKTCMQSALLQAFLHLCCCDSPRLGPALAFTDLRASAGCLLYVGTGVGKVISLGNVFGLYDVNLQHASRHCHILYALHTTIVCQQGQQ